VLLIDEVSYSNNDHAIYDFVKSFVDNGVVSGTNQSRRGAFFTGLSITSPWSKRSPFSGRMIVQIPLGTFDVWDSLARAAILQHAQQFWPTMGAIPERAWSLLAATGGRPRDIILVLNHIKVNYYPTNIGVADQRILLNALLMDVRWHDMFAQYLLPSVLNVKFCAFKENRVSAFGAAASSPALVNVDLLASERRAVYGVPAVSLRFARSIPDGVPNLSLIVNALVAATTFCSLDGSGKDFERVWIGMVLMHLLLQHAMRATVEVDVTRHPREQSEKEKFVARVAVDAQPHLLAC
jgi:hypothetical protein